MKNIQVLVVLMFTFMGAFLIGCSGSKEARTTKKSINGDWYLQTVVIEGNNSILNAKVFNEADNNCFIGSSWNLVYNNGSGSYSLLAGTGGCTSLTRKIHWSIYEPEGEERKFQFKRLDDNNKPLDDNNGYRLNIGAVSDTSMQLKSAITYQGKPVTLLYNFVKKFDQKK
jgi:hypothetical protein